MNFLEQTDPGVWASLEKEKERQEYSLELIASENYTSQAVMEAQGSVLTNKYAEGYPNKRYYGGCHFVDEIESLAIERAKKLFSTEHANVQPHSGSQANMAVYMAVAQPGDTILGLSLSHGGHLTHGSPVNFSGFLFKAVHYELHPETHLLDYDRIRDKALKHKPKILIAGHSAYPRFLDFSKFYEIAKEVGAYLMVDMAHFAGLVATGVHPSPVGFADFITTTTHKTLRGPRGGLILCSEKQAKKINSKIFPGIQGGPLEHVIAGKAVAFYEALKPSFKNYTEQILRNAKVLSEELINHGFKLITGGTDNHLMLIDLSDRENLSGKDAEEALDRAGITVNKNTIPNEKRSPFVTSGIRLGTPALTTRGMMEEDMKKIAQWIAQILEAPTKEHLDLKKEIKELCQKYPVYT